ALASFLILAGRRPFLDGHAIALLDLLAPAAVGIGDAIALRHPLAVLDLVAPALGSLLVLSLRRSSRIGRRRAKRDRAHGQRTDGGPLHDFAPCPSLCSLSDVNPR